MSYLTTCNLPWFMDLTLQVPMQYCFFTALDFTSTTRHIHEWAHFHSPSHFNHSEAISNWPPHFPSSILDTFQPGDGGHLSVSYFLAFSQCPWGSLGKNTGVDWHFLFQDTTFCQNFSLWPVYLGWPYTAWLIDSPNYANPLAMTSLWSTKAIELISSALAGKFFTIEPPEKSSSQYAIG